MSELSELVFTGNATSDLGMFFRVQRGIKLAAAGRMIIVPYEFDAHLAGAATAPRNSILAETKSMTEQNQRTTSGSVTDPASVRRTHRAMFVPTFHVATE